MTENTKEIMKFSQSEVSYTPVSTSTGQACAGCRWFDGGQYCQLVKGYPVQIMQTGWCNRYEGLPQSGATVDEVIDALETVTEGADDALAGKAEDDPAYTVTSGAVVDIDTAKRGRISTMLTKAFQALQSPFKKPPESSGFKVFGSENRWFAWWSNCYEDREEEFFAEKGFERYIRRVDTGLVPYPELWIAHIKGSRVGIADMVGGIGRFAIATGTFDDTTAGRDAKAYYSDNPATLSHGFMFPRDKFINGVYHDFNTFELTLLEPGWEANSYTDFEKVKSMQLSPEKLAYLKQVLPNDADRIIAQTEEKDKALEAMGVAYKDFATPDDTAETPEVQQAARAVQENGVGLFAGLIEDITSLAETQTKAAQGITDNQQGIDALQTQVKTLTDTVQSLAEAMKAQLQARPSIASKDDSTIVPDDQLSDDVKKSMTQIDSFWGEATSG